MTHIRIAFFDTALFDSLKSNEVNARRLELVFWGALLALAFYPIGSGWLAWIALARPALLIGGLSPAKAFRSGYLFSLTFNALALYWIGHVTPPGFAAAVAILSLYSAAVFSLYAAIYRWRPTVALLALPILWVAVEHFRTLSQFSFPWMDLSYSQAYYLYYVQLASVTGAGGISFAVVTTNSLLALALRQGILPERRLALFSLAGISVAVMFAYGWVITPAITKKPETTIGLLQGDIPLDVKWSPENKDYVFSVYDSLAELAGSDGARLIIWPETAAPTYLLRDESYALGHTKRARSTGAANLIGTMHVDFQTTPRRYYNAAVQLESDGTFSQPYLKHNLVPFAEHVPYQDKLPFLHPDFMKEYLSFIKTYDIQWWSDFYPGDSLVLLSFAAEDSGTGGMPPDSLTYMPFICFEVAYPEYVRESLNKGAEFILTITNDTWFKKSPGPFQHQRIAIMRAIENRSWLARAANSGFTFIADPYGRIHESMDWYKQGYVVGNIDPRYHASTFSRRGPVLARWCFYLTLALGMFLVGARVVLRLSVSGKNKRER